MHRRGLGFDSEPEQIEMQLVTSRSDGQGVIRKLAHTCVVRNDHHWIVNSLFRIKCKFPGRERELGFTDKLDDRKTKSLLCTYTSYKMLSAKNVMHLLSMEVINLLTIFNLHFTFLKQITYITLPAIIDNIVYLCTQALSLD